MASDIIDASSGPAAKPEPQRYLPPVGRLEERFDVFEAERQADARDWVELLSVVKDMAHRLSAIEQAGNNRSGYVRKCDAENRLDRLLNVASPPSDNAPAVATAAGASPNLTDDTF